MRYTPTRCGVRTHASVQRPDLKSGALNHSANLVVFIGRQGKIIMREENSKDCWITINFFLLELLWLAVGDLKQLSFEAKIKK